MLAVLFDVTPSEIGRFTSARLGPDGIPDTIDDMHFTTLAQVRSLLDVPPANYAAVSIILTLQHPILRTECVARVAGLERRLTLVRGPGIDIIQEE
jgi:hypothetical protein